MSPPADAGKRASENVRAEMGRQRMTRVELSNRTGLSRHLLERRLDDEVAFDVDELAAVAEALGVEVASLL